MTKEEKTLCEKCPFHKDEYCGYISRGLQHKCSRLETMMVGYEQACDDLAQTWEDVAKIITIYEAGIDNGDYRRYNEAEWMKEYSQDILKRFNEQKKK